MPRLELSPATVSVRLDKMIKRELGMTVDLTFIWTDSTSVLKYVANSHSDCSSPLMETCTVEIEPSR